MKDIMQKAISTLRTLLLLSVLTIAGGTAWADSEILFDYNQGDGVTTTKGDVTVSFGPGWSVYGQGYGCYVGEDGIYTITFAAEADIKSIVIDNESRDVNGRSYYNFGYYYMSNWTVTAGTISEAANGNAVISSIPAGVKSLALTVRNPSTNVNQIKVTVGDNGQILQPMDYTVVVAGITNPAAGVIYKGTTVHNNETLHGVVGLTADKVTPVAISGYEASVSLEGTVFTVTYVKAAYIEFTLPEEVEETKNGVSFSISEANMKTYRPQSGLNVYATSWDFTINSADLEIAKIELFEGDGLTMTYLKSDPEGCTTEGAKTTWEGAAQSVKFFGKEGWTGDYFIKKARIYFNQLSSPATYTVNIVGEVPEGCKVTLGNKDFTSSGTLPDVINAFQKEDLIITTPEEYFADVVYDAENYTYTVEFKHWYYYSVVVTHTMGALEYAGSYFGNDGLLKSKSRLSASDFRAYDLMGYDESIRVTGFGYNYTVTVTYTESAPTDYYIVFPEGTPAGTVVKIGDKSYTTNGTYSTPYEVRAYDFTIDAPEGYYADYASNCYDASTRTFTVRVHEYYHYTVHVTGSAEGAAMFGYYIYSQGQRIESSVLLTPDDVSAQPVDRHDAVITISGEGYNYTIDVVYTPYPTLAINALDTDADGNYWTTFSCNKPFSLPEGYTPYIVTGAEGGQLTLLGYEGQGKEYTYDLDFTTGAYAGPQFTAMDGALTVTGVNWIFNTPYGYAETSETEDWTTVTFSLADEFDGIIKSIRFLTANETTSAWFSYDGGYMGLWSEIPVNAKTMTLGAWYDQTIKHFYLDIEEGTTPIIPAGEGILVKAAAPAEDVVYTIYDADAKTVDTTGNLLVAGDGTVWNAPGKTYYTFSHDTDVTDGSAGFYQKEGGASLQSEPNKAYLVLGTASSASHYLISESGVATGIDSVLAPEISTALYNLQGQRVRPAHTSKSGIYVSGGKKFIVK